MKKKKIVFSSSGGAPAMNFLLRIFDNFGSSDVERIAAQIAATCRDARLLVTASNENGALELCGNTAMIVRLDNDAVALYADNVAIEDDTLIIN